MTFKAFAKYFSMCFFKNITMIVYKETTKNFYLHTRTEKTWKTNVFVQSLYKPLFCINVLLLYNAEHL